MIMNESGFFWLSNADKGERPASGQLTIDEKGIIELELNETFAGRIGSEALFGTIGIDKEIYILGLLKKSGKHIKLINIRTNGAQVGHISYEKFLAETCLISQREIGTNQFNAIMIPLKNLNNWSCPGEFFFKNDTELSSSIEIMKRENKSWPLHDGSLKIVNHLDGKQPNSRTEKIDISITSHFYYDNNKKTDIPKLLDIYYGIQDLLMILINERASVGWPMLMWKDNEKTYSAECYFRRSHLTENTFDLFDVVVPFPRIKDKFGEIVTTWFKKRKTLGPGINLYLSILRNKATYAENVFVNMVWGLEALDRRNDLSQGIEVNIKLTEKIKRISDTLKKDKILKSDDRNWLMNTLKRDNERSLAERLFDIFLPLGLNIDSEKLRYFCITCAHLRNDLSHHGGERTPGEYDIFLEKLIPHMRALSTLYLVVMLDILKISKEEIGKIIHYYPGSYKFKATLISAGLIPSEFPL